MPRDSRGVGLGAVEVLFGACSAWGGKPRRLMVQRAGWGGAGALAGGTEGAGAEAGGVGAEAGGGGGGGSAPGCDAATTPGIWLPFAYMHCWYAMS
jgi:hypothetical protein